MAASPGYPSSEQLLEKAWDENTDPFTKTVAVAIGRLRYKLEPASPSGHGPRRQRSLLPAPSRRTVGLALLVRC